MPVEALTKFIKKNGKPILSKEHAVLLSEHFVSKKRILPLFEHNLSSSQKSAVLKKADYARLIKAIKKGKLIGIIQEQRGKGVNSGVVKFVVNPVWKSALSDYAMKIRSKNIRVN